MRAGMASHLAQSRFLGAMLGHALGDALGAPHEGGVLERILWRCLGRGPRGSRRWTDDTQMALDVAASLLACGGVDQADLAARLARSYRWSRGYGPGAARTLRRIRRGADWRTANRCTFAAGSFGNGAATRAHVVGLWCAGREPELLAAAHATAEVTHAHPLAIAGARMIAIATAVAATDARPPAILDAAAAAVADEPFASRLALARDWLAGTDVAVERVRAQLGNGIAAADSCVTALYLALRCLDAPFGELVGRAVACRGDVDTIAAMAGAVWGARRGVEALPQALLARLADIDRLRAVAIALHERAAGPSA
jgi:poly(ADP-ribose) glycohydrolase ARH3